jgi:enoyl-CoA hydratase/carnithine racemase
VSELVLESVQAGVATLELNRPEKLNALSEPLMAELAGALERLDALADVRCIVLTGSDRAFAAGADVAELAALSAHEMYAARRVERWDALRRIRTPASWRSPAT